MSCCRCFGAARPTSAAAVLDLELRVRGVTGLRIADASVLPTITHAAAMVVAEKASDLIRAAWPAAARTA